MGEVRRRFAVAELLAEFARVGSTTLAVELSLARWFVLAEQVEVALRHPDNQGANAAIARAFVAELAARVTPLSATIGAVLRGADLRQGRLRQAGVLLAQPPLETEAPAATEDVAPIEALQVTWQDGSAAGGPPRVVLRVVGVEGQRLAIGLSVPLLQGLLAGAERARGEALATATGDARWRERPGR